MYHYLEKERKILLDVSLKYVKIRDVNKLNPYYAWSLFCTFSVYIYKYCVEMCVCVYVNEYKCCLTLRQFYSFILEKWTKVRKKLPYMYLKYDKPLKKMFVLGCLILKDGTVDTWKNDLLFSSQSIVLFCSGSLKFVEDCMSF